MSGLQTNMAVCDKRHFATPQIHQFEDKNDFIDSKYPLSLLLWNQGNHIMGHLWIQTDHNQDRKYPDYDQPGIMFFSLWQSMISPFLYGKSTREKRKRAEIGAVIRAQIISEGTVFFRKKKTFRESIRFSSIKIGPRVPKIILFWDFQFPDLISSENALIKCCLGTTDFYGD